MMTSRSFAVALAALALIVGPTACQHDDEEDHATPHYGALMAEVGRRFELLGRAAEAGRWKLAAYELHELGEVFEALEHAEPPPNSGGGGLRGQTKEFAEEQLAALGAAVKSGNNTTFGSSFATAADHCNDCHRSARREFIEVPRQPGEPVPRLDPTPDPS